MVFNKITFYNILNSFNTNIYWLKSFTYVVCNKKVFTFMFKKFKSWAHGQYLI